MRYDELIAALRFCDGGECDGCCRYKKEHGAECYTLLRDAADAIEELDNLLNLYRQGKIRRPNNDLPTSAKRGGGMNT